MPTSSPLRSRQYSEFDDPVAEVILFVGRPASGKTFFYNRIFKKHGYERIVSDIVTDHQSSSLNFALSLSPLRLQLIPTTSLDRSVQTQTRLSSSSTSLYHLVPPVIGSSTLFNKSRKNVLLQLLLYLLSSYDVSIS